MINKYKKNNYENQRSFEREPCNLKVSIKDPATYALKNVKSYNISAGGMGVKADYNLPKNKEITVKIHFSKKFDPFTTQAKVAWSRKRLFSGYYMGLKFSSMNMLRFKSLLEVGVKE